MARPGPMRLSELTTIDAPLVVRDETVPEDELADYIRRLTPGQQAVISALAENPMLTRRKLAVLAGMSHHKVHRWYQGSEDAFRAVFNTVQNAAIDVLPKMALSIAKRSVLRTVERDVELASEPNAESVGRLGKQLIAREHIYKMTGMMEDSSSGPTVTIDKMLVQIAGANEYPVGGLGRAPDVP